MYLDSQITDQVLTVATNLGFPVLGVHDSFIVPQRDQDTLLHIVDTAARELVGRELPVDVSASTLSPVRSDGYLARLEQHRVRYGLGG